MVWIKQAADQLGLGPALVYAGAICVIFLLLERNASEPAKLAIARWLRPKSYDPKIVTAAVLEIFDLTYTHQLLSWRALIRSILFTALIVVILFHELMPDALLTLISFNQPNPTDTLNSYVFLSFSFLSDYVSLFLVRYLLVASKGRPAFSLLLAPTAGAATVMFIFLIRDCVSIGLETILSGGDLREAFDQIRMIIPFDLSPTGFIDDGFTYATVLILAALIVHLWLPSIALSVALLRALNYFRAATGRTMWFLKEGYRHPLNAIGYTSALSVFVVVSVIHFVS